MNAFRYFIGQIVKSIRVVVIIPSQLSIINTEPSNLYKLSANKRMKNSQPLPSLHQHSDVQMLQREQAKKWATVSLTLLARAGLQAEQSSSSR